MSQHRLDYLDQLESESIHIFREVAGQFERPALLFSGGKDSIVLVHLALKAFRPGKFPFPFQNQKNDVSPACRLLQMTPHQAAGRYVPWP